MREWTAGRMVAGRMVAGWRGWLAKPAFLTHVGPCLFSIIGTQGCPPQGSILLGAQGHGDAQATGADSPAWLTPRGGEGASGRGLWGGLATSRKPHGDSSAAQSVAAVQSTDGRLPPCPSPRSVYLSHHGKLGPQSDTWREVLLGSPRWPVMAPRAHLPKPLLKLLPCPSLA